MASRSSRKSPRSEPKSFTVSLPGEYRAPLEEEAERRNRTLPPHERPETHQDIARDWLWEGIVKHRSDPDGFLVRFPIQYRVALEQEAAERNRGLLRVPETLAAFVPETLAGRS